ncbi:MAG: transcriptional regulator with GAF, ATPase, and Fis domain [Bradymonadia bacterium]|jgi:transcriptional regulator with GAF, ATPase, and Fis domain
MPSLVYTPPNSRTPVAFEVHKRVTSIGSGPDNDLQLTDPEIAETHALIRFDGRTFTLQSLASGQNIIINGKVRARHTLEHGDDLLIGGTCLTFHLYQASVERAKAVESDHAESYRRILEFSRKLLGDVELDALLEELMDSIIELCSADRGFLILGDGEELDVRVARNLERENIQDAISQLSDSIVSAVVRERKPLIVADALNNEDFRGSKSVLNLRLCSVMCVPLIDRERMIGLIYVGNDNVVNLFTEAHLSTLTIYAAQASLILARAIAMDELKVHNKELQAQLEGMRFGSIIGSCDAMRDVYRKVERIAATDVSVLVTGETGTGKELIAREIHNRSARAKGPFITINCGAIPENLLESELFGHVRGAFTGATTTRAGKFQAAHKGTLFLDEIGEMPLNLQVKILRALQDRTVTKVGENRAEQVDIRILTATHRDLEQMIAAGEFREDLYYRLNVVALTLPPLRDRGDDIELIGKFLLERFATEYSVGRKRFATDALIAMRKFSWPGNIRQLENHVKKSVILSERATIKASDLDLPGTGAQEILPLAEAKELWQSEYIRRVLEMNGGNRTKTARDLGVDPRTVFRFLEKEIDRTEP